jgi:hypothetical protein
VAVFLLPLLAAQSPGDRVNRRIRHNQGLKARPHVVPILAGDQPEAASRGYVVGDAELRICVMNI